MSYSSAYSVIVLDRCESTSVDILCYWSWLLINLIQPSWHLNYKLNLDFDFNWTCTYFFETWKHKSFTLIFFHPWMTKQYKPICYNTSPNYTMSYQIPILLFRRMFTHIHPNTWISFKINIIGTLSQSQLHYFFYKHQIVFTIYLIFLSTSSHSSNILWWYLNLILNCLLILINIATLVIMILIWRLWFCFGNIASVQMVLILIYWDIVDFIILLKNWIVL